MRDLKRFQPKSTAPTRQALVLTGAVINRNLQEMVAIESIVSGHRVSSDSNKQQLLYLGSLLYDYYLLTEDSLLHVARTIDRWVPASLDWHSRLLMLMQSRIPEKRPPVISPETALMLNDYLVLFLNFHRHCSKLTPARIEKMAKYIGRLHYRLEKELTFISRLFAG
jgi:hypothetical protein